MRGLFGLQPFVAPLVEHGAPMLVDEADGAGIVLIAVFLVALLALDVLFDGGLSLFPTWQVELAVDVIRDVECVLIDVLETNFIEPSLWQTGFLFLVGGMPSPPPSTPTWMPPPRRTRDKM